MEQTMTDEFDTTARRNYRIWLRVRDVFRRLIRTLLTPEFEPAVHATPWRLRLTALFVMVGNPMSLWMWSNATPAAFDDATLRWTLSALALPLFALTFVSHVAPRAAARYFVFLSWLQIPLLFTWMLVANQGSAVWLATCAAGLVAYYALKDWRLASVGLALAIGLVTTAALAINPSAGVVEVWGWVEPSHVYVLAFFWIVGLSLAISHADLRAENLRRTLTSVGIMAHELRTPLATVSMIGDALRSSSIAAGDSSQVREHDLGMRLHGLVRAMNHQIDTQIANASLLKPVPIYETVSAQAAVKQALVNYPFVSSRQRAAVDLRVAQDFDFLAALPVFAQVVTNLLKNALHAVARSGKSWEPGDVVIEVRRENEWGHIVVRDVGVGMDAFVQKHMLEPFFSTRAQLGHGLGLAFCEHAVRAANGSIGVITAPGAGATFVLRLPTTSSWDRPSA
jgi:two-component system, CAI-1 autoinducer sensor kinase/phosphatase CqsS